MNYSTAEGNVETGGHLIFADPRSTFWIPVCQLRHLTICTWSGKSIAVASITKIYAPSALSPIRYLPHTSLLSHMHEEIWVTDNGPPRSLVTRSRGIRWSHDKGARDGNLPGWRRACAPRSCELTLTIVEDITLPQMVDFLANEPYNEDVSVSVTGYTGERIESMSIPIAT